MSEVYSFNPLLGETINVEYRRYRRGRNRCLKCGCKLNDNRIPKHNHPMGYYEERLLSRLSTPLIFLRAIKFPSKKFGEKIKRGETVNWTIYDDTKTPKRI